jgi:glycosyltransferase involved in cell wall biosynthesis
MHIDSRSPTQIHALAPSAAIMPLPARTSANGVPENVLISCIIPCLNECDNLHLLLPALRTQLESLSSQWEIIVVDDGSTDGTADLMDEWMAHDGMRYVQLSRNFGKEAALSAGLETADGDVVICMDADMQHSPDLISGMYERWCSGADMVYALRAHRNDEPWLKRLGTRWFYNLMFDSQGVRVPPHASDFRLMDRKVVDALISLPERTRFIRGLYAWVGFKSEPFLYTPAPRANGSSHYGLFRLIRLALAGLTAFSTWPLRLLSFIGCIFALMSFTYGGYLVLNYLINGNEVTGWTTIVVALLFFSGVNLISVGVVGEYVSRIFDEVKGRPLFVARQRRGRAHHSKSSRVQP